MHLRACFLLMWDNLVVRLVQKSNARLTVRSKQTIFELEQSTTNEAKAMATVERPYDLEDFRKATKSASGGERIIIEIDGVKAAIVPVEDLEALEDAEDIRDAMKAMEDLSDTIPIEDVMKEYGLI
jgi:hypothetical protein